MRLEKLGKNRDRRSFVVGAGVGGRLLSIPSLELGGRAWSEGARDSGDGELGVDRFEVGSINGVTGSMVGSMNVGLFAEVFVVADGLLPAFSGIASIPGSSLATGGELNGRLVVVSFDVERSPKHAAGQPEGLQTKQTCA